MLSANQKRRVRFRWVDVMGTAGLLAFATGLLGFRGGFPFTSLQFIPLWISWLSLLALFFGGCTVVIIWIFKRITMFNTKPNSHSEIAAKPAKERPEAA